MNARQSAYFNMLAAVDSCCRAQQAAWSSFQPFADSYSAFHALYSQITELVGQQKSRGRDLTGLKESLREAVVPQAMRIARALEVFASINAAEDLKKDARTRPSQLSVISEKAFVGHVSKLLSLVGDIPIAQLAPFGLTATHVSDTAAALSAYTAILGKPEHAKAKSAAATKQLAAIIAEIRILLRERMDRAAELLHDDEPVFSDTYKICREIIDPGYRKRALEVNIKSADTGEPVPGATAIITPGNIKKKAGPSGKFRVDRMEEGRYTIRILHDKHQEYTGSFTVIKREGTKVNAQLESA